MVVVLNAKTGLCEAVMLDNAYLTDLRTGLAAVAARYLAPETVRTVACVIRSGRYASCAERVLVAGRTADARR